ncbi:MAG: hypothetical protein AAGA69_08875 [Pseudomonadota bacterium]
MRLPFLLLLTMMLPACATLSLFSPVENFNPTYPTDKDGQTIAFVGDRISIERIPYEEWCISPNVDGEQIVCLDSMLHARYRVIKVLAGSYDRSEIDFIVFDHGILNPFWEQNRVVLYVNQQKGTLVHHKYQYDLLSPLKSGGFAYCGDPYAEYETSQIDELGRSDLRPFDFYPPITRRISEFLPTDEDLAELDQEDIREDFLWGMRELAPPAYEIKGDIATCRMGMTAQEVANVRMGYEYTD